MLSSSVLSPEFSPSTPDTPVLPSLSFSVALPLDLAFSSSSLIFLFKTSTCFFLLFKEMSRDLSSPLIASNLESDTPPSLTSPPSEGLPLPEPSPESCCLSCMLAINSDNSEFSFFNFSFSNLRLLLSSDDLPPVSSFFAANLFLSFSSFKFSCFNSDTRFSSCST